jgi:hypothetical protein
LAVFVLAEVLPEEVLLLLDPQAARTAASMTATPTPDAILTVLAIVGPFAVVCRFTGSPSG